MQNFNYDEVNDRWVIKHPINEGDIIEKYNDKTELWERYKVQRDSNGNWHLPNGETFSKSWIVRHP